MIKAALTDFSSFNMVISWLRAHKFAAGAAALVAREQNTMDERDVPAGQVRRIERSSSIADFVADNAADGCAANGSDRAAAGQDSTADSTDASADGSAFVL